MPNPTPARFRINGLSNPHEPLSVEVRSLDGSLQKSFVLAAHAMEIDLSGIAAGTYLIRLIGQHKVYGIKCVVAHE
jgi:hypothetical protein